MSCWDYEMNPWRIEAKKAAYMAHLLLEKRSREVKMERRKAIVQAESMRSELQKYQVMLSELIDICNTALLAENMGIASSLLSN